MHAIERSTVELIVPRHTYITQRKSTIVKKLLCANITTFAIASQTNLPCPLERNADNCRRFKNEIAPNDLDYIRI